ncbi:Granzyme-like protein 2 [Galemys pyrenaicus]|uniref:Granzyme-like protein 2 n=1 Tax=Galemys pyrenaicus TaxID=202257 RepID=A0A8J6DEU2_GALPY|nr:Granzyme-like protein 2 [Galemys pyrenaicus]
MLPLLFLLASVLLSGAAGAGSAHWDTATGLLAQSTPRNRQKPDPSLHTQEAQEAQERELLQETGLSIPRAVTWTRMTKISCAQCHVCAFLFVPTPLAAEHYQAKPRTISRKCSLSGEIYGGKEAKPHSRPYMALVRFYDDKGGKHRCGGFLVRDDFVMTAAHCNGSNMTVRLGAHNISHSENTQQDIPVLTAFPHQGYDAKKHINDIMLLKLKKKARLTSAVQTIALPCCQDWVKPGQMCSVAGWGKTAAGKSSDTLQEVDLEVQAEQKCKKLFQPKFNNSIQLCVGNPKIKKATGGGDSGGPLVCKGVAQGIVSYAYKGRLVPPRDLQLRHLDPHNNETHGLGTRYCLSSLLSEQKIQESFYFRRDLLGHRGQPHSRPYMASVKYYDNIKGWRRCGGFLVRDDFVMTAAHCFGSNMTVTLGAHNIRKKENSQQVIPVLTAFPHQDYDAKKHINDIMLLKLKKKTRLNRTVQTIALPCCQDWVKPGQMCSMAGWGKTAAGKSSDTLQEVDLEVQLEQECKKSITNPSSCVWETLRPRRPLDVRRQKDWGMMELRGGKPEGHGEILPFCPQGDSGGPFVCKDVAQGIVCYACKNPEVLPRVFTRISSFITWIRTTMRHSWGKETSATRSQSASHVWGLLSDSQ